MASIYCISDGGSWYPEACSYFGFEHMLHSPYVKCKVERTGEYLKFRTEAFDDYYPCMKAGFCSFRHVNK
jgi:putative transposase